MSLNFKDYWAIQYRYLKPLLSRVIVLGLLVLFVTVSQIIAPFIVSNYIDLATKNKGLILFNDVLKTLKFYGIVYSVLTVIQYSVNALNVYLAQSIAWTATNRLRYDLTEHCINLDMTFHNKYKPGELIERIDGDVNTLATFLSQFSVELITSAFLIIGIVVVFFIKSWLIGLFFLILLLASISTLYFLRNVAVRNWQKQRQTDSELYGMIEEGLANIEDVKANGGEYYVMNKFFEKSRKNYHYFNRAILKEQWYELALWGIVAISNVLVFAPAIPAIRNANISLGTIFLFQMLAALLIRPIIRISRQLQLLQQAGASIKRINSFLKFETKIKDSGTAKLDRSALSVEFDNVFFSYNNTDLVLNGVSFKLDPTKSLGLIGHTGSGKTTISRLIFRLYDIDDKKGKILLNDINIKEIELEELRKQIAYVPQDVQLFHATLRDNISFFNKKIKDEKIRQILFDLGLEKWYNRLPNGLDTVMLSEFSGLSAGEEQLLALARAFVKSPNLVILDEASSRLDPATEKLIEEAIDKLLMNRSAIIIAHRLSTLKKVDDILILDKGKVVEYGNREKLANDSSSYYYRLLKTGAIEEVIK